jgi:hypothetical protein
VKSATQEDIRKCERMKLPAASCGVFGKENTNFRAAQHFMSERLRAIVCAVKESIENRQSRWARSFVGRPCVEGERANHEAEDWCGEEPDL